MAAPEEDAFVLEMLPSTGSDLLGLVLEEIGAKDLHLELQQPALAAAAPGDGSDDLPSMPSLVFHQMVDEETRRLTQQEPQLPPALAGTTPPPPAYLAVPPALSGFMQPAAAGAPVPFATLGAPQPAFGSSVAAPFSMQQPFASTAFAPAVPAALGLQLPSGSGGSGSGSGLHLQHGSGGSDASTDLAATAMAAAYAAPRQPHGGRAAAAPKRAAAGGGAAKLTDAEKLERERAKNRASQARYRVRQKEIQQQLEQTYAQTADDLERERALHERLTTAQATMALMKDGKDALLEAAAQLSLADGPAETSAFDEQQQLSQLEQQQGGQQQQAGQQQQSGVAVAANAAAVEAARLHLFALPLAERVGVCCDMFRQLEPATPQQLSSEPEGFAVRATAKPALVAQLVEAHPLFQEVITAMTPEQLLQEWDEFGGHLAQILEQLDGGRLGEAEATERLHDAYLYNTILYNLLLMHNTTALRALLAHTRLPGETPDAAEQRWLHNGVVTAGMSRPQADKMIAGYRRYCQRMRQLGAESEAALAALRAAQQSLYEAAASSLGPDSSLAASMKSYLALAEASGALSAASDGALLVLLEFVATGRGSFNNVLQRSRFVAGCRPLHPDAVALTRALMRHFGVDDTEADALVVQ